MDDPKYDDLDKLFQSRLSSDKTDSNDWNTPPAFVFDNAMDQVDADKKRKRGAFWIWFLGAALLLSIVGIVIYNFVSIQKINQSLADTEQTELTKKESITTNTNQITTQSLSASKIVTEKQLNKVSTTNTVDNQMEGLAKSKASVNKASIQSATIQKTTPTKTTSQNITNNSSSHQNGQINTKKADVNQSFVNTATGSGTAMSTVLTNTIKPVSTSEINNNDIVNVNKEELTTRQSTTVIEKIQSLSNGLLALDQDILPISSAFYFQAQPGESQSNNVLTFNAFGGILMSSFSMTNLVDSPFSLTGYEDYQRGYFVGIGANKNINDRLFALLDVAYNRVNNLSEYQEQMSYDKENETMDAFGNNMYTTDYTIESTMGRFSGDVDIPIGVMDFSDGQLIENNTAITQRFDIISSNLGLGYTVLRKSNLELAFIGSIGANYILNLEEDMDTEIFIEDMMMKNKSIMNTSLQKSNRIYGSINGGIRLQYRVNNRFGLSLNAGLERAITTMRKCATDKEPATYINNRKLSLSANYSF